MTRTDVQSVKQRFGIIGTSPLLDREIEKALLIAPTDLSVLIVGESGVGKEVFPQVIHQNSIRKHGTYIAVNCGAIPEGTIDSELFGHEKGSFTGALGERKGYFEVSNGGTVFLDEVGEMPMATQARLLRVLEYGEFIKVGSSKVQKTDVRIVAATNVDLLQAIRNGKFREDLYYRLNTVPVQIPPLRNRKDDVALLFRKFAGDFAEKYRMPAVHLTDEARSVLIDYRWPGNIRELKNITERMSIIEKDREISASTLKTYLTNPDMERFPALMRDNDPRNFGSEREILYQVLFDMKKDVNELKKLVHDIMSGNVPPQQVEESPAYRPISVQETLCPPVNLTSTPVQNPAKKEEDEPCEADYEEETMSLEDVEREMIRKALDRNNGRRRNAALELKISERTLYRKIKEYGLLYILPLFLFISCSISYSFKGGKIDESIKTVKITDFINQAQLVYPPLTQTINREMRTRMIERTSLKEVSNNANLEFEGEITDYRVDGTAVKEDGFASMAKLTITVKIRYTNNIKPEESLEQTFSSFREFSSSMTLEQVQDELISKIATDLVDMVYNATVGNW